MKEIPASLGAGHPWQILFHPFREQHVEGARPRDAAQAGTGLAWLCHLEAFYQVPSGIPAKFRAGQWMISLECRGTAVLSQYCGSSWFLASFAVCSVQDGFIAIKLKSLLNGMLWLISCTPDKFPALPLTLAPLSAETKPHTASFVLSYPCPG